MVLLELNDTILRSHTLIMKRNLVSFIVKFRMPLFKELSFLRRDGLYLLKQLPVLNATSHIRIFPSGAFIFKVLQFVTVSFLYVGLAEKRKLIDFKQL